MTMEDTLCIGNVPIEGPISRGFPVAMFEYQRVLLFWGDFFVRVDLRVCPAKATSDPQEPLSCKSQRPNQVGQKKGSLLQHFTIHGFQSFSHEDQKHSKTLPVTRIKSCEFLHLLHVFPLSMSVSVLCDEDTGGLSFRCKVRPKTMVRLHF